MEKLREYLQRQIDARGWSYSKAADATGVAKTTIHNILAGKGEVTLETLDKLGRHFELPLWRMLELAGYDPGLPMDASGLALRIEALKRTAPEMGEVLDHLAQYDRRDVQGVLVFLETMAAARRRQAS